MVAVQADLGEPLRDRPAALGARHPADRQREFDVAAHAAPGQQAVVLEDQRAVGVRAGQRAAVGEEFTAGGRQQAGQRAQQGGLAAAGRADHGQYLAGRDVQVDAVQDGVPGVAEAEVAGGQPQAWCGAHWALPGRVGSHRVTRRPRSSTAAEVSRPSTPMVAIPTNTPG